MAYKDSGVNIALGVHSSCIIIVDSSLTNSQIFVKSSL